MASEMKESDFWDDMSSVGTSSTTTEGTGLRYDASDVEMDGFIRGQIDTRSSAVPFSFGLQNVYGHVTAFVADSGAMIAEVLLGRNSYAKSEHCSPLGA
mmetsp:Transcript_27084/g.43386  ORF Transcript_27084/g.43386 Transcript_27084/m.43386 type:complete len:99 (-) Transcript_27084:322-618(-)